MKAIYLSAPLLLILTAPVWAAEWVSFPMSEGPDIRVDRSSIRRDTEGSIVPWAKGWTTAKTETGSSPGYFVTDCRDQYYSFSVDPETKAIQDQNAQPMRVAPGSMAKNIQTLLCSTEPH